MKKSLTITNVRPIFNIERPIVVFEVAGNEPLVRNPKQALTDLQNSGRALNINVNDFAGGYANANPLAKAQLVEALFACNGAVVTADITNIKAGDSYTVTAGHPALTDKNHKDYGKVKEGGQLKAEKDGVWIEGFMSIPLTPAEMLRKELAVAGAATMLQMFGITAPTFSASVEATVADEFVPSLPEATAEEAFGKAGTK